MKTTRRRGKAAAAIVPEEQVTPESDASSTVELQLPASFTIADVAEVHSLLRDSLVAMSSLSIDAAQVETIDTAGLQLLAAAHKTAVEKGVSI
ncbi:MAG: STAS domain-containing protein, partial [Gammaproteobacteria bacterium]|nr:STAS domain-containing protein [Gammaproteobacteria bacterium]